MKSIIIFTIILIITNCVIAGDRRDRKDHEDYIRSQSSGQSYDQEHWNNNDHHRRNNHGHDHNNNDYDNYDSSPDDRQEELQRLQDERQQELIEWQERHSGGNSRCRCQYPPKPVFDHRPVFK